MQLLLAPMEGLIDPPLRHLLTETGGYDRCIAEFIRVSDRLLPRRVFRRVVPELLEGGKTPYGTPVAVQLMGNDPAVVADNGARAAELGAPAVDLNFGCPSKFVNRKGAGAWLLQYPEEVYTIASQTRTALPDTTPLTAKMRLGYEHTDHALEVAMALEEAGVAEITVHARTQKDGYRAEARWEWIARVREAVAVPIVANGDITDLASFQRCLEISGCDRFMLGRAAVANPILGLQIKQFLQDSPITQDDWSIRLALINRFIAMIDGTGTSRGAASRVKQLLSMFRQYSSEAEERFYRVRRIDNLEQLAEQLKKTGPIGPAQKHSH